MQCFGRRYLSEVAVSRRCPIFTTSSDIYGRWLGETGQRLNIIDNLDRDLCIVVMCGNGIYNNDDDILCASVKS
jgi:hypothetical protein